MSLSVKKILLGAANQNTGQTYWLLQIPSGYIMTGASKDPSNNIYLCLSNDLTTTSAKTWVFKFDSNGDELWQRELSNSTYGFRRGTPLWIDNAHLCIAAQEGDAVNDLLFCMLDPADGTNEGATQRVTLPSGGVQQARAGNLQALSTSEIYHFGKGSSSTENCLQMFDDTLNMTYMRDTGAASYGSSPGRQQFNGKAVNSDGSWCVWASGRDLYARCEKMEGGANPTDGYRSAGGALSNRNAAEEACVDIHNSDDIYFTGYWRDGTAVGSGGSERVLVGKLNSTFDQQWIKEAYNGTNVNRRGWAIDVNHDGDEIAVGIYRGENVADVIFVDASGNLASNMIRFTEQVGGTPTVYPEILKYFDADSLLVGAYYYSGTYDGAFLCMLNRADMASMVGTYGNVTISEIAESYTWGNETSGTNNSYDNTTNSGSTGSQTQGNTASSITVTKTNL